MSHCSSRRHFLRIVTTLPLIAAFTPPLVQGAGDSLQHQLAALERRAHGRLGMALLDSASGQTISYRGDERFAMCSTFKALAAAAILQKSLTQPDLLSQRLYWNEADKLRWMPITAQHMADGMTVGELCAAMLQYSDNLAANLMLKILGGPGAVSALARSLGDNLTRLDRTEPSLNSAMPGDPRDTTTPVAMARTLQTLAFGNGLPRRQQQQWVDWLKGNTTGRQAIAAGIPAGWSSGDKTGSGDYGTTNDVALLWPPEHPPLVLTLYFTQPDKAAITNNAVLAEATRLVLAAR